MSFSTTVIVSSILVFTLGLLVGAGFMAHKLEERLIATRKRAELWEDVCKSLYKTDGYEDDMTED